jgi:hypothetical protein
MMLSQPDYMFLTPISPAAERAALSSLRQVFQGSMVSALLRWVQVIPAHRVGVFALGVATQSEARAELAVVRGLAASAVTDAPSPQIGAELLSRSAVGLGCG